MENYIIIAAVVIIVAVGIRSSVKHFGRQGGCCSGGEYRVKKKRLSGIIFRKTFSVAGMHCSHCKNRVEEAVNDIKGAAGKADFKKGRLEVSYSEDIEDSIIIERVEKAGYTVTGVRK